MCWFEKKKLTIDTTRYCLHKKYHVTYLAGFSKLSSLHTAQTILVLLTYREDLQHKTWWRMKKRTNLPFLLLMSLFSLEEMILIKIENLLSEMERNPAVNKGVREVVVISFITTNHCSRIPTTKCSSGLLTPRYSNKTFFIREGCPIISM